jgi:hypothetical protein
MAEKQFKFEVFIDYEDGNEESEPMMGTQKEIKKYILDALEAHRKGHELEDYLFYMQVVSKRSKHL